MKVKNTCTFTVLSGFDLLKINKFFILSGYLTMERQLSCDSVSSVTSTVSGASLSSFASLASRTLPQHYSHNQYQTDTLNSNDNIKVKKRSWVSDEIAYISLFIC